jgi:hypothetical protein
MTWVRIEDTLPKHPKILAAGPLAAWLHVAGLCYSASQLTDGFIPAAAIRTLVDFHALRDDQRTLWVVGEGDIDAQNFAERLVEVGLWEEVAKRGRRTGYRIHDYLDFNPSRRDVLERRAQDRARKQGDGRASGRARSARNPSGIQADSARIPEPRPIPSPRYEGTPPTPARRGMAR